MIDFAALPGNNYKMLHQQIAKLIDAAERAGLMKGWRSTVQNSIHR